MTAVDTGLRLNLGCNDRHFPGFLNVDIVPPADFIVDLATYKYYFCGGPIELSPIGIFRALTTLAKALSSDGLPGNLFERRYDRWPWDDGTVDEILAYDVLEHLPSKRHAMNEIWRVLKPGGIARLQVPHATDGDGGHCDPTHVSYWTTSDFEYYARGIAERERFRNSAYYGVKADFAVRSVKTQRFQRSFGGHVVEIQAVLEALK